MATATATVDERLARESRLKRLFRRPELGAIAGSIAVWIVFALIAGSDFASLRQSANFLRVSSQIGILSIAVSLLMIAGEFDLSIGSLIGASGMITAVLSKEYGWSIWTAMIASLLATLVVGALNGLLVIRTRLPSFIITLGTLFIIRGATIGLTRLITGVTVVSGLKEVTGYESAANLFASSWGIVDPSSARGLKANFDISLLWWLLMAALATWVLLRTQAGNWIFGIGGDSEAARNVGVPVNRMKIILFMTTAASAWLLSTIQIIDAGSADTVRGEQQEFFAIIVTVIGGTLLTGGYGSAIGAVFGALIYGMVQVGIPAAKVDSDWFFTFLGAMLIIAVLVNNYIRKMASEA